MFDIGYSELLLIAVVALVVIGPKDLPRVMRTVGQWVGRARGMARHFRSGIDTMIRESEIEEIEKKWKEENERIMREHPFAGNWDEPGGLPPPADPPVQGATGADEMRPLSHGAGAAASTESPNEAEQELPLPFPEAPTRRELP
jgi:sec-independent protein translocase protein TatB